MKIAWMMPELDLKNPAHRVRRYNLHNHLKREGYDSLLIHNYREVPTQYILKQLEDRDIIVWTDLGELDYHCMSVMSDTNKVQIFDHCENLWGFEWEKEMMDQADLITCSSSLLTAITRNVGYSYAHTIRDPLENYDLSNPKRNYDCGNKLKAVYMGGKGHDLVCEEIRPMVEEAGYELVIISGGRKEALDWDPITWKHIMLDCDVGIALQDHLSWPAKSNIKATIPISLGLPTLASPMNSYSEIISDGVNGFICREVEDWYKYLIQLKDPELRKSLGIRAHATSAMYSLDYIGRDWIDLVLRKLKEKNL